MKIVFYYSPAKNYPSADHSIYDKIIPAFVRSAQKYHEVIQLKVSGNEYCDSVSYDLDPQFPIYNREYCYSRFLKDAPEDQYAFLDPDMLFMAQIPHIETDFAITYRTHKNLHSGAVRIAKKTAQPIFDAVLKEFSQYKKDRWICHGDSFALNKTLSGITDTGESCGCTVKIIPYEIYQAKPGRPGILTHFKGKGKKGLMNEPISNPQN